MSKAEELKKKINEANNMWKLQLRPVIMDINMQDILDAFDEKDMEIKRLNRALYKACANWAHIAVAFFSSYETKERWNKMERRCLYMAKFLRGQDGK